MQVTSTNRRLRLQTSRLAAEVALLALAAVVVGQSAYLAKRSAGAPAFVAVDDGPAVALALGINSERTEDPSTPKEPSEPARGEMTVVVEEAAPAVPTVTAPEGFTRYFDGRPIRAAKTLTMTVTAYSPDERSCGEWADGYTATNHSVWTNAMKLVAADTRLLPFGSMVSVPGYANGDVVPVLDRGGAIKGHRLDVLFPTHEIARQWGRRKLQVIVWEFADGLPSTLGHRKRG